MGSPSRTYRGNPTDVAATGTLQERKVARAERRAEQLCGDAIAGVDLDGH